MLYEVGDVFDTKAGVEFGELFIYELPTIIGYDSVRDNISAYDVLPYEMLDLLCCYCGQWLSFYPFCKIVNADNENFHLSFPWGEGSQDVHPPLCKWPRGE